MTTILQALGAGAGLQYLKEYKHDLAYSIIGGALTLAGAPAVGATALGAAGGFVLGSAVSGIGAQIVKRYYTETSKVKKGWGEESRRHANFANISYTPNEKRSSMGNWTHMKHLSNDRISIFEENENWHIALRGTDPASVQDLLTDLHVISGDYQNNPGGDFLNRGLHVKNIIDLHGIVHRGKGKITMSGHSLGGTMVAHMMSDPKIASKIHVAHVFNAGAGIFKQEQLPSHLHMHSNTSDWISFMNDPSNGATHHYHTGGHGMHLSSEFYQDHEEANLETDSIDSDERRR